MNITCYQENQDPQIHKVQSKVLPPLFLFQFEGDNAVEEDDTNCKSDGHWIMDGVILVLGAVMILILCVGLVILGN